MLFLFKISRIFILIIFFIFNSSIVFSKNIDFENWLNLYKQEAFKKGISQETINIAFKDVKFLEKVIQYDRKQPEFFEDTLTYVNKRATSNRANKAKALLKKNKQLFNDVELQFNVEKEILLSLWGIETNFGRHVGKMDIISSLATLSYDTRRRDFFSNQLFILLKLIDRQLVDPDTLYGSWAGAFGNFQFMPSTIDRYAIDYDKDNKIDLKLSLGDSLASAANYINKIGWERDKPCFYRVKLKKEIKEKYINTSARKISYRMKINKWKQKGVINFDGSELKTNYKAALILPDGKPNTPTYLVFGNYEKVLKWNRSLRFGISVCTLAKMIKT